MILEILFYSCAGHYIQDGAGANYIIAGHEPFQLTIR
jgi:hypothetical protein